MFSYETLENMRDLEMFLESEEEIPQSEEKETSIQRIKNYFTGNSNDWCTYKYYEKTNEIKYPLPRTFSGDIKNYFSKIFSPLV